MLNYWKVWVGDKILICTTEYVVKDKDVVTELAFWAFNHNIDMVELTEEHPEEEVAKHLE